MLSEKFLSALVCPKCTGEIKQSQVGKVFCFRCGQTYLVRNSIPIILKEPEKLLSEIKQKTKQKPGWYKSNQIDSHSKGPYKHHYKKRVDYLRGVFERYNFRNQKVLDAGCGDGISFRLLFEIPEVILFGTDYNLVRLRRAQKTTRAPAFLVLGDLLERHFKENYFDMILCNHVLEHIEKDLEVLKMLYKILKPGGILILGTPNEGVFIWQLNYKVIQPSIMRKTDHVHFYTVKKLKQLLGKAGFAVKETKLMGWGLPHTMADAFLRQFKWIDDLFEKIGSKLFKSQATSLYFICKK